MPSKARSIGRAVPITHPCSFQHPLCLWDMDEAPASICGQSPGEVLGFLRTAFSVYNNCRVVAYNGSTSVLHHSASSEPVPGSHARLMAQLMEVHASSPHQQLFFEATFPQCHGQYVRHTIWVGKSMSR